MVVFRVDTPKAKYFLINTYFCGSKLRNPCFKDVPAAAEAFKQTDYQTFTGQTTTTISLPHEDVWRLRICSRKS